MKCRTPLEVHKYQGDLWSDLFEALHDWGLRHEEQYPALLLESDGSCSLRVSITEDEVDGASFNNPVEALNWLRSN